MPTTQRGLRSETNKKTKKTLSSTVRQRPDSIHLPFQPGPFWPVESGCTSDLQTDSFGGLTL